MEAGAQASEAVLRGGDALRIKAADYFEMTKPKVQSLLLFTTVTTMYVAGDPSLGLVALTCLGGALSAGGAGAINHVLDRDIDAQMRRTVGRPVPSGRVSPRAGLLYGIGLGAASFALLALAVNPLAAALSLVGLLGYVFVYTLWLKRRTPQNIVIGGAAGAFPPMIGWAAATGEVSLPAVLLFLIIFVWTPPHFWALALLIKREYQAAGVPMLPVVRGDRETARQILLYSLALVPVSLLPVAWRTVGVLYLVAALALGAWFVLLALRLRRETTPPRARVLFHFSLAYLAVLFVAMAVDPLLV